MTDKRTEELNEAELDQVAGGFSFGVEREVKLDPKKPKAKQPEGKGFASTAGGNPTV